MFLILWWVLIMICKYDSWQLRPIGLLFDFQSSCFTTINKSCWNKLNQTNFMLTPLFRFMAHYDFHQLPFWRILQTNHEKFKLEIMSESVELCTTSIKEWSLIFRIAGQILAKPSTFHPLMNLGIKINSQLEIKVK